MEHNQTGQREEERDKRGTRRSGPRCLASPGTVYIHKDQASQAAFHPPYLLSNIRILDVDTRPILHLSSPYPSLPAGSNLLLHMCVCVRVRVVCAAHL